MKENIEEIIFDQFTLNIDVSGNVQMTTIAMINILLQLDCKIHIINYTSFNVEDYLKHIIESNRNKLVKEKYQDIFFVKEVQASRDWLMEYTGKLSKHDFVFINDARRLISLPLNREKFLTTTIGSQTATVHFESEENWSEFISFLDSYYTLFQDKIYGIISIIYTDDGGYNNIKIHLENVNSMSVISTGESDILDTEKIKEMIYTSPLCETLKKLEQLRGTIDDVSYRYLTSTAYYHSGDITNAIGELEAVEDKLNTQNLVALADLFLKRATSLDIEKAEKLLLKVYESNKLTKNLFPTFFRLYKNDKSKLHEIIMEALKYDPDDLATIEMNASRLSSIGEHIKASKEFRKLASLENYPLYELIARINEVIAGLKITDKEIVSYIEEHVMSYPAIKNEAMLRLANYFIKYKSSYFNAYNCLTNAEIGIGAPRSEDVVKLKIDILKDESKSSKALRKLKPYIKPEDAQKLNQERCKVLMESIDVFSLNSTGFLHWRDFIESQSVKSWSENIYAIIQQAVDQFVEIDIKKLLEESFVSKSEKTEIVDSIKFTEENYDQLNANVIKIVRNVFQDKECTQSFEDFEELFKTILTVPMITNNQMTEIWGLYYLSLIASTRGNGQRANEIALTLFDYIDRTDKERQKLCQCLGLIAWANTQYRAGRKIEGISCVISAIKLSIAIGDPLAIIETGINILGRYLKDVCLDEFERDIEYWRMVNEKILRGNKFFDFLCESSEKLLLEKIEKCENKDAEWAGDVVNLIALHSEKKQFNEVYFLLEKYSQEAIEFLQRRKDILFHVLYNWSNGYLLSLKYGGINNLYKAASLSEKAVKELEEFRYSYSHKEERSGLGDITLEIYKNHIVIHALLFNEQSESAIGLYFKKQILSTIHNVLPRTLIEQKKYHSEFKLTDELKELQKQYVNLKLEYDEMVRKQLNDIDEISSKAEHILLLEKELKKNHPYYMPLKKSNSIDFDNISANLEEEELCFQYVITFLGVLTILTEKNKVELYFDKCDTFELQKNIDKFSCSIQENALKSDLDSIAKNISDVLSKRLKQKLSQRTNTRLYCISDFNGKLFPIIALKNSSENAFNSVKSIVNIVDYNTLTDKKNTYKIKGILNKIIGKKEDAQIKKWINWLKSTESDNFNVDSRNSDDLSGLDKVSTPVNTLAIYGHGLSDPNESTLYGAKGIEGQNSIISFEDISEHIVLYDNLIIISCRGGTPDYDQYENFYGLWSNIFERFHGAIILCKWDVPTNETITLVNSLLKNCINTDASIDESLLYTQSQMGEHLSIQLWGGIEFWLN